MASIGGSNIVKSGLVLSLDAANARSYPGSGTTWRDLSGNSNNGTLTSGPTFSSSNVGIIQIPLNTSYVDYGSTFTLGAGDFAIELWYKIDNLNATIRALLEKRGPSFTTGGWCLRQTNGGVAWEQLTSATYYGLNISSIFTTDWIHLVVTRIGTTLTGYVNGVQGASQLNDSNNYNYTATTIKSGTNSSANLTNGGAFSLGSVKIYKGAGLTQAQVTQNFNATKGRFGL
jgi:hypothetical protein